jgi:hypothetical protein
MAYSQEEINGIFDFICLKIEEGLSLRAVLRMEGMPSSSTVFIWLDSSEEKSKQYARSTEIRAEGIFDEMIEISDTLTIGETITEKPNGVEITRADMPHHRRLQIDTRKWALSKMNPKKYGDKIDLTTKGKEIITQLPPIILQAPNTEQNESENM